MEPEKLIWVGFFLMWPMMFFSNYFITTPFYNFFGILTLVALGIMLYSFIKILKKQKRKNEKNKKR